jgi:hypothetical protein
MRFTKVYRKGVPVPKKRAITQQNTFEGITVDVSDISEKLTERARRFVFWYCYPGTDAFQHKTRAAIRAGYAARNAKVAGYKPTKNPEVTREIERLSEKVISERIDVMYNRYVDSLETRAFYDPADFISGNAFKPIEEIAPEKRVCLEQPIIDTKEAKIVGYSFGSRRAAMAEIKEIHQKAHPGGGDEFDVEETIEIMNRVAETKVCIERRKRNEELSLAADYIEAGKGIIRSEL